MILGLGSDIIDIRRIERLLEKNGARFKNRVFTKSEQKKAASRKRAGAKAVAATYAKRFAAKEACVKALGVREVDWLEMEIGNLKNGAPTLTLHGKAQKRLKSMTPRGKKPQLLVTLADDYPYALALVVIAIS